MRVLDLDSFAKRNHGLVTRQFVVGELGLSGRAWSRAVASGLLTPVHPRVARLVTYPVTTESTILAAVLSLDSALASHRSAAYLWGAPLCGDTPVDVLVVAAQSHPARAGVIVHRGGDRGQLRPIRRRGIPATNPLRTLLDLGAVDAEALAPTLAAFAQSRLVSISAATDLVARHAGGGRHGVAALRTALAEWRLGTKPPDSVLEETFARLLADYGLPAAEFHPIIAGFEVDFVIVGTRLVVECDGWAWHGVERERFERDRYRDAELGAAGYIVRRFSWHQITTRAAWVAQAILRQLVHLESRVA